jgi:hypothetical protein
MMTIWRESLIHERVFGGYVVLTLIRLLATVGPFSPHTLIYAGSLALIAGGIFLTLRDGFAWAWRARLAVFPVLTLALFVNLRRVSPLINDELRDALLQRIDRLLAWGGLPVMLEPLMTPMITEALSFCYMFFMVYVFVSVLTWLFAGISLARTFYAGLFSIFGIGYLGYTLVPAVGPWLACASAFSAPPKGYFMTDFLTAAYPIGTNYTDAFPSLHCAVTLYLLLFDMKWNRARFRICLLPCVGIILSTIGLRYHYLADVIAGCPVAAVGLWIAGLAKRREDHAD